MDNVDELWDFGDAAASENQFRQALSDNRFDRAETLTQLARSIGLQKRFDEANQVLHEAEAADPSNRAEVRILLERGRVLNSSGDVANARLMFEEACRVGSDVEESGLVVDAMHMIAITCSGAEALRWNLKAIDMASHSDDPDARRWLGSLHNNTGWSYHEIGDYHKAMEHFQAAVQARQEQGRPEPLRVAHWCVARCLRSLGQYEDALQAQLKLLSESGDGDGYGYEEVAECLLSLGRFEDSKPYFAKAYELLSADEWLAQNEADRLDRLKSFSS